MAPYYSRNQRRRYDNEKRWQEDGEGWWKKEHKQHDKEKSKKHTDKGWGAYVACNGHGKEGKKCGWSAYISKLPACTVT